MRQFVHILCKVKGYLYNLAVIFIAQPSWEKKKCMRGVEKKVNKWLEKS